MTQPEPHHTGRRKLYYYITLGIVGVIVFGIVLLLAINKKRNTITLSNGSKFRITYIGAGKIHKFDDRSLLGVIKEHSPEFIERKITGYTGEWSEVHTTNDSVGIEMMPVSGSPRNPRDFFAWTISDKNGWYYCPIHPSEGHLDFSEHEIFTTVPRTPKDLTILFYDNFKFKGSTGKLIGSYTFPNPSRKPIASSLPFVPRASTVTSGNCTLENINLLTGVYLEDEPPYLPNDVMSRTAITTPASVKNLIAGKAVRAVAPQHARSALVFRPFVDGKNISHALRKASIVVTDSYGQSHPQTRLSKLFQTTDTCALVFDVNLPVTDGEYHFDLTLYLDPPPVSTSWVSMKPIIPGNTSKLVLGSNQIEAGMTERRDVISLSTTLDPSLLAIRACVSETSEPLKITLQDRQTGTPNWSYAVLSQPVTSGTVTLSFEKLLEHKLTFPRLPVHPK